MSGPRRLPEPLSAYRIGDPAGRFPVFSAEGARRVQGRWHAAGDSVIYASEHYSTALLETLVRWSGSLPPNQHFVEITLPAGISYEVVDEAAVPDWHSASGDAARRFGHDWYSRQAALILMVPSMVARVDRNIVINAAHPEFPRVKAGLEVPIWWDKRLFR